LIYILLVAAEKGLGVTAALHEWIDAGVIFAVVLVNAIIGFLQESKAAKALGSSRENDRHGGARLASGEIHEIPSVELVPGDIVLLQSGTRFRPTCA
jgi:cation-transporting P-type ATPase F